MMRSVRKMFERRGFTLVEVAIAVAIVAALTGAVAVVVSQNANDAAGDITDVDTRAGEAQAAADAARATLPGEGSPALEVTYFGSQFGSGSFIDGTTLRLTSGTLQTVLDGMTPGLRIRIYSGSDVVDGVIGSAADNGSGIFLVVLSEQDNYFYFAPDTISSITVGG